MMMGIVILSIGIVEATTPFTKFILVLVAAATYDCVIEIKKEKEKRFKKKDKKIK
jgi:chromate transport protein ChrA